MRARICFFMAKCHFFKLIVTTLPLTACSEVAGEMSASTEAALVEDEPTVLVQGIGDAENATFSSDGRLFVTGGENVYEIVLQGSEYVAKSLYAGTCNFTGIVERSGYLYTACVEGELFSGIPHLLAAPLTDEVSFSVIYDFEILGIPNGIAFDERGRLFVTDFTPLMGKIVALSFDATSPTSVTREDVWYDMELWLANGLKIFGGSVYMTDFTDLKVIPIKADGSAGRVSVLATRLTVLDDLYVDATRVLVGDFYGGELLSYSHTGALLGETADLFRSPSSITPGRAPLVSEGAWIVTEKGELGELASTDGNRVSAYLSTKPALVH